MCTNGIAYSLVNTANNDPRLAWTRLCAKYQPTTIAAQLALKQELLHCNYSKYQDADQWFTEVERLHHELNLRHGIVFRPEDVITHLISSLPKDAQPLVISIKASLSGPNPLDLESIRMFLF